MKKRTVAALGLLLGLGWGTAESSYGQGRDTAFAVHKLFEKKRGSSISNKSLARELTRTDKLNKFIPGAVLAATPFLIGLSQAERYCPEREADLLRRYAQGQPLPADVRRRLRRRHFHLTAQDVLAMRR